MRKRLSTFEQYVLRETADGLVMRMRAERRGLKTRPDVLALWKAMVNLARELYARLDLQSCKGCGCTEDLACEDGCGWTRPEWCSQCAPPSKPPPARKNRKS